MGGLPGLLRGLVDKAGSPGVAGACPSSPPPAGDRGGMTLRTQAARADRAERDRGTATPRAGTLGAWLKRGGGGVRCGPPPGVASSG